MWATFQIECLCGAINRSIKSRRLRETDIHLTICHCDTCRHSSGILCMSYYPCQKPQTFVGLRKYEGEDEFNRFFCVFCGCHAFRHKKEKGWEVATGVMKGRVDEEEDEIQSAFEEHWSLFDTKDGGLSRWLLEIGDKKPDCNYSPQSTSPVVEEEDPFFSTTQSPSDELLHTTFEEETLPAKCDCGNVKLYITRPNEESSQFSSPFPDLMVPYHSDKVGAAKNEGDRKWWIVNNKYRAGTCACRSCRLSSGFELQTWAFIPRCNIYITLEIDNAPQIVPLDFDNVPQRILQSFNSSEGVTRNFCGICGATVFWHSDERPELVDVSVGLLRAPEGARAEKWLSWWKTRVSFSEEAGKERWGDEEDRSKTLVKSLLFNMKISHEDDLRTLNDPVSPF